MLLLQNEHLFVNVQWILKALSQFSIPFVFQLFTFSLRLHCHVELCFMNRNTENLLKIDPKRLKTCCFKSYSSLFFKFKLTETESLNV